MSSGKNAGKGEEGVLRSRRPEGPAMLGRKSVLMGMLTSGFVIAGAAKAPAASAGTVKPIVGTQPTYALKWTPSTAYALGQQVISPNNDVVSADVAHTSSSAYASDVAKWTLSPTFACKTTENTVASGRLSDASLAATYAPVSVAGMKSDYTGRKGTAGQGTDNRAALQAALTAASNVSDTSTYWGYLGRRSVTVKLAPGHYWISAPSGGASPSLMVPIGVTLDASAATLYFDYPNTPTDNWCAIQLGQYANLVAGQIFQSLKVPAPDTRDMYDGVRLVLTDNHSYVTGYASSEISGFQGAGVRGVGAWISYVRGMRITGCSYGYVASRYGTAFNTVVPGGPAPDARTHTDLWVVDTQIENCRKGGFLGQVSGDTGTPNALIYDTFGGVVAFQNCTFEDIGAAAITLYAASTLSLVDCHFEEAGKTGRAVILLDTVRVVTIQNLQYNLCGRIITQPDGTSAACSPSEFFNLSSVQTFSLNGFYVYNTYKTGLAFSAGSAPTWGWQVHGVYVDGTNDFAPGTPLYSGRGMHSLSGAWNKGHLTLGTHHMWVDASGALRHKATAPTSDTDGTAIA
jgi:hypothetical protein